MKSKILVFQTAFLGDLLLCIPLIKRIKNKFPDNEIHLVCRSGCGQIFIETGLVDKVFEVNKSNKIQYKEVIASLKKETYESIFCPHYSVRSNLIVKSLKAKNKIGFSNWWNFIVFNTRVKRNLKLPDALRQLQLISHLDAQVDERIHNYLKERAKFDKIDLSSLSHRILVPEVASMSLKDKLQKHPRYNEILKKFPQTKSSVFMAPGSVWNTKKWTDTSYRELTQKFNKVSLIGSPQEKELCSQIARGLPHAENLAGIPSLFELFVLLTQAKLLVCNDSGSMHMGSVAETPTVAIFGPTVLEIGYQPWQNKALVVENKNLDCRPCGLHGPQKCPLGHHNCMKTISSDQVYKATTQL